MATIPTGCEGKLLPQMLLNSERRGFEALYFVGRDSLPRIVIELPRCVVPDNCFAEAIASSFLKFRHQLAVNADRSETNS